MSARDKEVTLGGGKQAETLVTLQEGRGWDTWPPRRAEQHLLSP